MSDEEYSSDDGKSSLMETLKKFSSTRGAGTPKAPKVDKRAETSRANAAKARATKLAKLKQKKEEAENQYEIEEEDSEDEDESEEELEIKPKAKKGKGKGRAAPPAANPVDDRLSKMEAMLMSLAKPKKKAVRRKTIIQVGTAPAAVPASQKAVAAKQEILGW